MEFTHLMRAARRWGWLLLTIPVLLAGVTYVVAQRITPTYEASATVFVNTASVSGGQGSYAETTYALMLAKTFANLIATHKVADRVAALVDGRLSGQNLLDELRVTASTDTPLITVAVRDAYRVRARLLAHEVAAVFISQNEADQKSRYKTVQNALEKQMTATRRSINVANTRLRDLTSPAITKRRAEAELPVLAQQINLWQANLATLNNQVNSLLVNQAQSFTTLSIGDDAQLPTSPVSPQVRLDVLLALALGAIGALAAIVLVDYLDDSLRSPELIEEQLKAPLLGVVSRITEGGSKLIAGQTQNRDAEALKILRTNIQFTNVDQPPHRLLITSPCPGEGKSTIAANYAISVAQTGQRVVLVDADLRRPGLQRLFGLSHGPGLTDVLRNPALGLAVLRDSATENLKIVTSGPIPPNPSELLGSQRMGAFLDLLLGATDVIIVDAPPILIVADASVLAARMDGVVLVLDQQRTKMRMAVQAMQSLRKVGAYVVGVVVNRYDHRRPGYGYGVYYATAASPGEAAAPAGGQNSQRAIVGK